MDQQQHGDVLINRINELPKGLKKVKDRNGRLILADGEVTGHAHAIPMTPGTFLYEDEDGTLYLETEQEVTLTHEEHAAQTIEPGIYEVGRVVEVDPFEDAVREVAD
jgi:hypothetical protein